MSSKVRWAIVFTLGFWLVTAPAANAYVDPGTGSYVFQVLVGIFLGAAVAVKLWWRKLWSVFRRRSDRNAEPAARGDGSP
jgi:cytochrome b